MLAVGPAAAAAAAHSLARLRQIVRLPLPSKTSSLARTHGTAAAMATGAVTALAEVKDGAFVRTSAGFRNQIQEGGQFPPEGEHAAARGRHASLPRGARRRG